MTSYSIGISSVNNIDVDSAGYNKFIWKQFFTIVKKWLPTHTYHHIILQWSQIVTEYLNFIVVHYVSVTACFLPDEC